MEIENKNLIYLGGFGGIGKKCVEEFLTKNLKNVFIFDLKEDAEFLQYLQKFYKSSVIRYIKVDVTDSESIETAYKEAHNILGNFDIVVNGFGVVDDTKLDLTIDINLRGVIRSSLIALNYMDKSKGGRGGVIVNISSAAGIECTPMFPIYTATKHAVTAFTRSMASSCYFHHTQVNFIAICPGFTATPLLDALGKKTILLAYAEPVMQLLKSIKYQSAGLCAKNLVAAVAENKLGAVWLLDLGERTEVTMPILWKPSTNGD